jgi:hypothetical protein
MLDLIVAKALAKQVDERYQSMRELAADLLEVKRQFASAQPAAAMVARNAPSKPKGVSLAALGLESGTRGEPGASVPKYQKHDDETTVQPLMVSTQFDSFEATLKLAALTDQTMVFEKYISDTQKLRAYQGANVGKSVSAPPNGTMAVPRPTAKAVDRKKASSQQAIRTPERGNQVRKTRAEARHVASNRYALVALGGLLLIAISLLVVLIRR